MNIKGAYKLKASPDQVWKALNDPEVLRSCTPGCKQMISTGEDSFDVVIEIGIASIKGRYTGQIKISDRVPNSQYKLAVSGTGTAGFMNATGSIQVREQENETLIEYVGEAHVGGLGQRVMEGVAKLLVGQFFECLGKTIHKSRENLGSGEGSST
jgi:carbon monoxide dehydrogenase subunit G